MGDVLIVLVFNLWSKCPVLMRTHGWLAVAVCGTVLLHVFSFLVADEPFTSETRDSFQKP